MYKILVCDPVGQEGIDYLKSKGHKVILLPKIAPQDLLETVITVDALIVRGRTKVTKDIIETGKKLKVIARSGTGVDTIDVKEAHKRNIVVVNAPGANAESVAEHTFAFMLSFTRSIIPAVNTLKSGIWAKSDFHGMELAGKTLGVVGFGHIGSRVAGLGSAFGMNILVFSRKPPAIGKQVPLSELLSRSDFVSLHVPATNQTRGMIGAGELNQMKKSAFLINTARGSIVDEQALIAALKNGRIAGAALDVFASEPLLPDSELLKLPNVIVTPHVAADSREGENRASLMVAKDVDNVLQGLKPICPV